jgi:hypothetical protein
MGEEAGTGVKMFLERLSGAHKEEQKYIRGLGLNFWAKDKTAKFLGVDNAINEVRTKLSGVKNERLRNVFFSKIFREEGGAFAKLVANSDKSFKQWTDFIDEHKDINQKMSIWASEYNASWVKLITTAKSSSASVFDSWLIPLTKVNDTLNDIIGKVGEFAEKHPKVTDTFNGVLAAGVATAAGYAAFKLAKAAWYGGKVMKGLRGLPGASLAAGVAEGKMLQAATGVTPVFVTNWPEGGLGSDTPFVGPPKPKIPPETVNTVRNVLPFLKKMGFYSLAAPVAYLIGSNLEKLAGGTGEFNADQTPDNWKFQAPWSKDDQKNNIHIDLQIDSSGRVTSRTDSMDTRITMLPRGDFFTAMTSLPAGY